MTDLVMVKRIYRKNVNCLTMTQREKARVEARIKSQGDRYLAMYSRLRRIITGRDLEFTKTNLLAYAHEITRQTKAHLDRDAYRTLSCLVCWFCEHLAVETSYEDLDHSDHADLQLLMVLWE
jgi:hypothetical protein